MNKAAVLAVTLGILTAVLAGPAQAQQTVNPKAKSPAKWYNSPREIQIIDERPMVRDFREAPVVPASITLPPGPGAIQPGQYGGGAGALSDGGGGDVLPSGGMPIGGQGDPGYRTPVQTSPVPLDKADFSHRPSNIPAGGMGPKVQLPGGFSTGVHGAVSAPIYIPPKVAAPAQAMRSPNIVPMPQAPVVQSYNPLGDGYGNHSVGTGGGGAGTHASVAGKLLKKQN